MEAAKTGVEDSWRDLLNTHFSAGEMNACGITYAFEPARNEEYEPCLLVVGLRGTQDRVKFPGGKSEFGETPFETVVEEVCEEVGYTEVGAGKCIHYKRVPSEDSIRRFHHKFWFVISDISGGPLRVTGRDPGITAPFFLPVPQVGERIIGAHRQAFEEAVRYYLARDHQFRRSYLEMCRTSIGHRELIQKLRLAG